MAGTAIKFFSVCNVPNHASKICSNFFQLHMPSLVGGVTTIQIRERKLHRHINITRPRFPTWYLRQELVDYNENITPANKQFIDEIVHEKFGPPAIISGLETFQLKTPLRTEPQANKQAEWTKKTRRTGLIGRKLGVQVMWDKKGKLVHTTMIQISDNHVVKYIPPEEYQPKRILRYRESNRFGCLLVGAESTDPQNYTREYCGLFAGAGLMPKRRLGQFMVSPEAAIQPGTPLYANHFKVGDVVDVRGLTIFHGFEGVMKRHGFAGMPATHGATKTHRKGGNTGGGGQKARVWPGTKMPGHMGNRWRLMKGLKILRINTKYNILYVKGFTAGFNNGYLYVYDTILPLQKRKEKPEAFPTFYPEDLEEPLPEDIIADNIHQMSDTTIMFKPEK